MNFITQILVFILIAGIPYFYFLKKSNDKDIFFIVILSLILGTLINVYFLENEFHIVFLIVSLLSSIFAISQSYKTSNFYKLSYLFIFINSPIYFIIDSQYTTLFIVSIIINTFALFMIGKFFEKQYGNANFYSISSLTLKAPKLSLFLKLYLLSLALFPPFSNSTFLIDILLQSNMNLLIILTFIIVFLGNFFIATGILTRTIFGQENERIFYVDLKTKDLIIHITILSIMFILSIYALVKVLV